MTTEKMANPHLRNTTNYTLVQDPTHHYTRLNPIPSPEELKQLYDEDYYQNHYPDWIEKTIREQDYWYTIYEDRYDIFEKHIQKPNKTMLDIGSFLGLFLEVGQKREWKTVGIEPSTPAREFAQKKGIPTLEGLFENYTPETIGTFDAINLALEHIHDPKTFIERAYTFLNPGGILCIEVPNDFNPLQKAAQDILNLHPYWVAPPHHINYFSKESLSSLVESCGFKVTDTLATFPMELFLMMGTNYIGNDDIGRTCHTQRMTLEMNLKKAGLNNLKLKLYTFFTEQNIGREIILFGQKP